MASEEKIKELLFELIHNVQEFPCEIIDVKQLAFSIGNVPNEFISGGVSGENQFTLTLTSTKKESNTQFLIDRKHPDFQSVLVLLGKIAELQNDQDLQIKQMVEAAAFAENFRKFFYKQFA